MKASRLACAAVATAALITGAATPAQAAAKLVVDSFEFPPAPANGFTSYNAGDWIGPWVVSKGSVDVVRENYWDAAHGRQSVDLSGSSAGAITRTYQKLIPGVNYRLSFQVAGNPECGKGLKYGDVWIDGKKVTWFVAAPATKQWMDYDYKQVMFKTKWFSKTAKVTINSNSNGYCGPVIDDVRLSPAYFH
ncbi:DUF642 domain-containing protein [Actinoplanes sp. NPDC089786]|uniref:DUF642 domain-containing protein n=1 Tax=Actinoplanes sp. NPDC089786 TaxID=3155185 RepID=UPI0034482DC0